MELIELSKPKFISFSPCSLSMSCRRFVGYRCGSMSTVDREAWLEWRNKLKTVPTSSLLCSYFGYGFASYNATLIERIFPEKKTTPDSYLKRQAMLHGSANEGDAKKLFTNYLNLLSKEEDCFHKEVESGQTSRVYHSYNETKTAKVICTPDMTFLYRDEKSAGLAIAEFKCPFYCMVKKGEQTTLEVVLNFVKQHPEGKESAFIQAASYCMIEEGKRFYTVFYFTDTVDEKYIIIYSYIPDDILYDHIFTSIYDTRRDLKELNRLESVEKNKKYRTSTSLKQSVPLTMRRCLEDVILYDGNEYYKRGEIDELDF